MTLPLADALTAEHRLGALRQVIDPELGLNVVDLGLIYSVRAERVRPEPG